MTSTDPVEVIARAEYSRARIYMPYAHLKWEELGETQGSYLAEARGLLTALKDAGYAVVEVEEPALTCPGIDEALAMTSDPKLRNALERVRFENSNMRYSLWHYRAEADRASQEG